MNQFVGFIYLVLGIVTTSTVVGRLYQFWDSYQRPRKTLLMGYVAIMFGFTERGIELLWLHAPGPRPASFLAIVGAIGCLWAFLMPEDPRLQPESWRVALQKQEPENYDHFMEVLSKSAQVRNETTHHPERYKTTFTEDS